MRWGCEQEENLLKHDTMASPAKYFRNSGLARWTSPGPAVSFLPTASDLLRPCKESILTNDLPLVVSHTGYHCRIVLSRA